MSYELFFITNEGFQVNLPPKNKITPSDAKGLWKTLNSKITYIWH